MDNKTIFVITVFEKCEEENGNTEECYSIGIGCTRSPCFKHTFEEAEEVVLNNIGDIWETSYDYAVIEEIDSKLWMIRETINQMQLNICFSCSINTSINLFFHFLLLPGLYGNKKDRIPVTNHFL